MEGYALVVGKHGDKLRPSIPDPTKPETDAALKPGESNAGQGQAESKTPKKPDSSSTIDIDKRGAQTVKFDQENWAMHFEISKLTMEELAGRLKGRLGGHGHQVEDQTGMKGRYQVACDCPMKTPRPTASSDAGSSLPSDPERGSPLARSLDAMGLKLEKRKILIDAYVIDQVERSSAN